MFSSIVPAAVAVNTANQMANLTCQMARRINKSEQGEQPTTQQESKKNNIRIKATKKEIILLIILLIAIAATLWLLVQSCLDLFA